MQNFSKSQNPSHELLQSLAHIELTLFLSVKGWDCKKEKFLMDDGNFQRRQFFSDSHATETLLFQNLP